ncbi:hypothetical protein GF325_06365 [Candidatus Bathyarchaeota archaeon]|nr:hypothetical protein [Candidatus Bathyarchaeota archaeon]
MDFEESLVECKSLTRDLKLLASTVIGIEDPFHVSCFHEKVHLLGNRACRYSQGIDNGFHLIWLRQSTHPNALEPSWPSSQKLIRSRY